MPMICVFDSRLNKNADGEKFGFSLKMTAKHVSIITLSRFFSSLVQKKFFSEKPTGGRDGYYIPFGE